MVDNNLTIFSKIEERTFAFTSDRFLDKADMIGKQLDRLADAVGGTFFQYMAQRGKFIDVENTSGAFSGSYPGISKRTWDKKKSKGVVDGEYGSQNRFYFFKGDLENSLRSSGPTTVNAILGKSTFRGLMSDKFSQKQTTFRYGRGATVGGKKVGGQFGRISDISTTVEIDLFSKIDSGAEVTGALAKSSYDWAKKLAALDGGRTNPTRIPARPLTANYFKWFIENEVPKQFLRGIATKKWSNFSE